MMDDPVSDITHFTPWDMGVFCLQVWMNLYGCFANDFKAPANGFC